MNPEQVQLLESSRRGIAADRCKGRAGEVGKTEEVIEVERVSRPPMASAAEKLSKIKTKM